MTVPGIDPGATGALALLTDGGGIVGVHDMPTVVVKAGGKNRTRIVDAGLACMACAASGVPVVLVPPAVWRKAPKVTACKDGSREMAMRLWPVQSDLFRRVKDDGRAESALIAFYGRRQRQQRAA